MPACALTTNRSGLVRRRPAARPPAAAAPGIHTSCAVVSAPTFDRAFARWCLTVECDRPRRWAAAFSDPAGPGVDVDRTSAPPCPYELAGSMVNTGSSPWGRPGSMPRGCPPHAGKGALGDRAAPRFGVRGTRNDKRDGASRDGAPGVHDWHVPHQRAGRGIPRLAVDRHLDPLLLRRLVVSLEVVVEPHARTTSPGPTVRTASVRLAIVTCGSVGAPHPASRAANTIPSATSGLRSMRFPRARWGPSKCR